MTYQMPLVWFKGFPHRNEFLDQLDKFALLDKGIIDHAKYEQLQDSIIADFA